MLRLALESDATLVVPEDAMSDPRILDAAYEPVEMGKWCQSAAIRDGPRRPWSTVIVERSVSDRHLYCDQTCSELRTNMTYSAERRTVNR